MIVDLGLWIWDVFNPQSAISDPQSNWLRRKDLNLQSSVYETDALIRLSYSAKLILDFGLPILDLKKIRNPQSKIRNRNGGWSWYCANLSTFSESH